MSISEGDDAYIRSLIHFFGNQPDPWGIKDTKSVFIYANQPFRELVGMKNRNVEGLTDADMDCETAAFADSFQAQDRLVEQGREKKIVLDVHPYANGWRVFTFTKTPLIMPSGRVAGTIFHGQDLTDTAGRIECAVVDLLLPSSGQAGSFETNVVGLNLTEREELVLFFLLRGRTAKDIAGMLGRSPRTIEHAIECIRNKFGAGNKRELIDMSMSKGYYTMVPKVLFHTQVSMLLK